MYAIYEIISKKVVEYVNLPYEQIWGYIYSKYGGGFSLRKVLPDE